MPAQNSSHIQPSLESLGITNVNAVYWNLSTPSLIEEAVRRREGRLAHLGPLVVRTGQHTGRAPNDKFIVREPSCVDKVWWGKVNRPLEPDQFDRLHRRLLAYLQGKDLFVQDCFAGADPAYRLPIRVVTETAWHNLFARNMFIQPDREQLAKHIPRLSRRRACRSLEGRAFVPVEDLARITNGSLSFEKDRIILTAPDCDASKTDGAEAAKSGFSRSFKRAAIEAMASIREWSGMLMITVQNGYPVSNTMAGNTIMAYQGRAADEVALAHRRHRLTLTIAGWSC